MIWSPSQIDGSVRADSPEAAAQARHQGRWQFVMARNTAAMVQASRQKSV